MKITNLRYADPKHVYVLADYMSPSEEGSDSILIGPNHPKYDEVLAETYGRIQAYTEPSLQQPSAEQLLYEARERASLSRMQFKLTLLESGLLEQVEAFVAQPDTPLRIKIMWQDASSFDRTNLDLISMAAAMGFTPEQVDAMFGIEVPQ